MQDKTYLASIQQVHDQLQFRYKVGAKADQASSATCVEALLDRIAPALKAGRVSPLKVLLLLRRVLLLLCYLLLVLCVRLVIRCLLLALPCATHHRPTYGTNRSTLASITRNCANRGATKRSANSPLSPLATGALLRRRWRCHRLGGLRRVVASLPFGPGITLGLILLLLLR